MLLSPMHSHCHTHIHTLAHTDENPVIQIDTSALQQQSLALGSPVDTFLQDPSFVEVTPDGLTIPQSGGGGGSLGLGFTAFVLLTGLLAAFGFN